VVHRVLPAHVPESQSPHPDSVNVVPEQYHLFSGHDVIILLFTSLQAQVVLTPLHTVKTFVDETVPLGLAEAQVFESLVLQLFTLVPLLEQLQVLLAPAGQFPRVHIPAPVSLPSHAAVWHTSVDKI
jgi:hypothetical protein